MRIWFVIVIAGCGSKAAPPPVIANQPPPPKPAPAPATCADVGVILRGDVDDEDADKAKEQAIEAACKEDKWSRVVIDCVASTPHPMDCLDKLEEAQLTSVSERIEGWGGGSSSYTPVPDLACADVVRDARAYFPTPDVDAWSEKLRRELLGEECEHNWSGSLKSCLERGGRVSTEIEACFQTELDAGEVDDLSARLAALDRLAMKAAAAQKKPAKITCAKVVAAHYGDAAWKHKLDGYKPAERKRLIAESRAQMTKACTADGWNPIVRSCVVVGGGTQCFEQDKLRWGYPATGTVKSVGIAECDDYSAAVLRFAACNKLAKSAQESIVRSQDQMLVEIARLPAAERAKMGANCTAAMDAITESLGSIGC